MFLVPFVSECHHPKKVKFTLINISTLSHLHNSEDYLPEQYDGHEPHH